MRNVEYSERDRQGIVQALQVARTGVRTPVSEADEKLLEIILHKGECDVEVGVSVIAARFAWLPKRKPSTYFSSLAPGLISQLMDLGGVETVADAIEFAVGPATTGTERYRFSFPKKWVSIQCSNESILVRVRDLQQDLSSPLYWPDQSAGPSKSVRTNE